MCIRDRIKGAMQEIDFKDWKNIQFLTYFSNIATLVSNLAHLHSIHQKSIGHRFPSYFDNIKQLPKEILRTENDNHKIVDEDNNIFEHQGNGEYTSETKKNVEGENIKFFFKNQGLNVDIPKHIEHFKLHMENDNITFRHNNHKVLGFYFYENENDIKNKIVAWY